MYAAISSFITKFKMSPPCWFGMEGDIFYSNIIFSIILYIFNKVDEPLFFALQPRGGVPCNFYIQLCTMTILNMLFLILKQNAKN